MLLEVPDPVDIHRELSVVLAASDLQRNGADGGGLALGQMTQPAVYLCRGRLHQPERADETGRHGTARDRKVLHRALGLRAPQRIGRDLQLAHAVVFDAVRLALCHADLR
jgi:hypothetical protein